MIPTPRPAFRHRLLASALLLGAALSAGPAAAQDMGQLLNRLNRLENEVDTLNRQVYRGAPPAAAAPGAPVASGNLAADFEVRLQRLEREIATLTGRNEEVQHGVAQMRQRLDRLQEDLDVRFEELEKKISGTGATAGEPPRAQPAASQPAARPPQPQQAAAQGQLPGGSVQEQYDRAFQLLTSRDYAKAEQAFAQFLAANPNHALVSNAQYWLGETYYARNMYREAAKAYGEGFQKSPKGPKAPDNLLKLGMSLGALGSKDDACLAYAQLNKAFPEAPATIKRRAEQERRKLNCA